MGIEELVAVSKRYGGDDEMVIAGGGNTSVKEGNTMFVKASGTTLADIEVEGFARMDLTKLTAIMEKEYPQDSTAREAEALKDLMDARIPGEEKRPSVETLLHGILPYRYVVHTHPALVNGLSCSQGGAAKARELFNSSALWVPVVNPGYILAKTVDEMLKKHRSAGGGDQIIFLQNHGVFVQGDSIEEIDTLYEDILSRLRAAVEREPLSTLDEPRKPSAAEVAQALAGEGVTHVAAGVNRDLMLFIQDRESFEPLSLSFTPDHIVYAGYKPLFIESFDELLPAYKQFAEEHGAPAKVVVIRNSGFYSIGNSEKAVSIAKRVFLDGIKIAVYTKSFGGHSFMPQDKIDFIRNWEVEQYRSKISAE